MKNRFLFFLLLVFITISPKVFAQIQPDPTAKIGAKYKLYLSVPINLISIDSTNDQDESQKASNLGGVVGFYEKIFTEQFGVGIYAGQLIRQTKMVIDSIGSVVSDNSFVIGAYAKSYTEKAKKNGLKYFVSAQYETIATNTTFKNGPVSIRNASFSTTVTTVGLSTGLEYKLKVATLRLEGGLSLGKNRVIKDQYQMLFNYDSFFVVLGIMSVF